MKNSAAKMKQALFDLIRKPCDNPKLVAHDLKKDFTRKRKLWPERLIRILLAWVARAWIKNF